MQNALVLRVRNYIFDFSGEFGFATFRALEAQAMLSSRYFYKNGKYFKGSLKMVFETQKFTIQIFYTSSSCTWDLQKH